MDRHSVASDRTLPAGAWGQLALLSLGSVAGRAKGNYRVPVPKMPAARLEASQLLPFKNTLVAVATAEPTLVQGFAGRVSRDPGTHSAARRVPGAWWCTGSPKSRGTVTGCVCKGVSSVYMASGQQRRPPSPGRLARRRCWTAGRGQMLLGTVTLSPWQGSGQPGGGGSLSHCSLGAGGGRWPQGLPS